MFDLLDSSNYKYNLLTTEGSVSPRGIAVDPTTRYGKLHVHSCLSCQHGMACVSLFCVSRFVYWCEWGYTGVARISKASMDGTAKTVLHQSNLGQPYGIAIDFDNQVLYWGDLDLQRIESSNVDGSSRRVVVSSGVERPFDLTLLGDTLYISDWNLRIRATNKSGGQPVETLSATFCTYVNTYGIQVIAEERQLLGEPVTLI